MKGKMVGRGTQKFLRQTGVRVRGPCIPRCSEIMGQVLAVRHVPVRKGAALAELVRATTTFEGAREYFQRSAPGAVE